MTKENTPQNREQKFTEQQRKSQRMEQGVRTGKSDINEEKRQKNNPNQPS